MEQEIKDILAENARRHDAAESVFHPVTGRGSILPRTLVELPDFPLRRQWLPDAMLRQPLVAQVVKAGSLAAFFSKSCGRKMEEEDRGRLVDLLVRVRCRYDFPFWAATFVYIKAKGGGDDVRFVLNRPQRRLIETYERMRLEGRPIRLVLLKARQWGGSTATQIYMAWLQLVHRTGLNSLIVAHVKDTAATIRDMFDRMIKAYPAAMLHRPGEPFDPGEDKLVGVNSSINTKRVPQRNCDIKVGSAEVPNSARGGDYSLVHCSETALWKTTEGKTPEDIVRSACSGVLLQPMTMIVYESTANGTGNFFQREYDAAKRGQSQFEAMFVPWYEIGQYSADIPEGWGEGRGLPGTPLQAFARWLHDNRENDNVASDREESGRYLWWLWRMGATLESIWWYVSERSKYSDHGDMASEYPSDDIEAFVHSGARVFDRYKVEALRADCRPPRKVGDVSSVNGQTGEEALTSLSFKEDRQGLLWVWSLPEVDEEEEVTDRYLVVVDIGGRSAKADWSAICVFDRLYMADGEKPVVCAQWYGHIDMDLLAWKAAQIAAFYDNALLVIESNTLETHDRDRMVDGDQSTYILNKIRDVYPNLYARKQSAEEIRQRAPRKYGFHTNVKTKPEVVSTLVEAVREGLYVERDERCLDEYLTYERKPNGAFGAITGKHDDLLMTRAIGLHVCFREMPLPAIVKRNRNRSATKKVVSEATI